LAQWRQRLFFVEVRPGGCSPQLCSRTRQRCSAVAAFVVTLKALLQFL
jgi:hypothetical protein